MVKRKINNFVYLSLAALLFIIVAVVSRPEKEYGKEVDSEKESEKTAVDELGDFSKDKPDNSMEKKVEENFEEKNKVPEKNTKENIKKFEEPEAPTQSDKVAGYVNQHKGAGVHAVDKIDVDQSHPSKYPMVKADFSNVRKLNFGGLKKVYTYFRLKDKFPDVVLKSLNGAAVEMTGAIMPVDKIPDDGVFPAFWLSNPVIVLAGCVFCNPPTMADIIYVSKSAGEIPFSIEREKLFKQVVLVKVVGKLIFGPEKSDDQVYLFRIEAEKIEVLN